MISAPEMTGSAAFDPANLAWGRHKRWLVNDELEPIRPTLYEPRELKEA